MHGLEPYLEGKRLYGNDFDIGEIRQWYDEEKEGYAELGAKAREPYHYEYHELNRQNGYNHIPRRRWEHVLGLGSAYGDEFKPVKDRIDRLTILEPSDLFPREFVQGIPATYVKPEPTGDIPFRAETFDLITCLGCLHHIPNVSHVLAELYRCLAKNGYALIRDPISSLGDWRKPRIGGTKNERGIPLGIYQRIITAAGFRIIRETLCMHGLIRRPWLRLFHTNPYNSQLATAFDRYLSHLTSRNLKYHRTTLFDKLKPGAVYYVVNKPA